MACNLKAYALKSEDELRFILSDARLAADCATANKDLVAESKYLDQINDAATTLYRRNQLLKKVLIC
jgi:hypothetical protein